MKDLICDVCHKKTKELYGFDYSEIKMCNKCYILHLEGQCENLRSYILNSFSENDREKFLNECCKGKLFDDVLKTFKPNINITKLEQELAELKEKAIVPRFKRQEIVYCFSYGEIQLFNVVAYLDNQITLCENRETGKLEFVNNDYLCINEQEAQEKLKEMQGNG